MSTTFLACLAIIFIVIFKLLNVNSSPQKPKLYCKDELFKDRIMKICSAELTENYIPTRLWGFSGHVQTILQSLIGRVKCPWSLGDRIYISMPDGSTLTYDLYQPLNLTHDEDITVAVCPGVGNSSESVYIRTFVHYAQCHGYRMAVLNHIGVIDSINVTSPRIFTYGHTDDYAAMINSLVKKFPTTHIISVGFSLGGNLVTKYLGEKNVPKPANIIGAVSICQGYDANTATQCLLKWQNFQRFYLYVLTENVKSIIMKHRNVLLNDEVKRKYNLNEREIVASATLPDLDEAYTCKIHNFPSTQALYSWSSCINYLKNIEKPIIFINSVDDPLVPEILLRPIREFAESHPKVLYIETQHGGHLGFYEHGLINPNPLTWLDRILVSLLGGIAFANNDLIMKRSTTMAM
ncbi:abhydrolase domain-containing protein 2 [Chironomus tepperi]|uniref:abhydrolase domain-containing protein 2 n=1 Tax=Chironomus tepperi TaxID=113505 RepID=UPI00391F4E63